MPTTLESIVNDYLRFEGSLPDKNPTPPPKDNDGHAVVGSVASGQMESGTWLPMAGPITATSDLDLIASRGDRGSVVFWDLKSKRQPQTVELGVEAMQFTTVGNQSVLVAVTNKNTVIAVNQKGKMLLQQPLPSTHQTLACNLEGDKVAVAVDNKILVWQIAGAQPHKTLTCSELVPSQLQFSSNSRHLMVIGMTTQTRTIQDLGALSPAKPMYQAAVLDLSTGEELYRAEIATADRKIAISANWQILAIALDGGPVALWDWRTGEVRTVLVGHRRPAASLALSATGRIAVTGGVGKDTCVILWNAANDQQPSNTSQKGL